MSIKALLFLCGTKARQTLERIRGAYFGHSLALANLNLDLELLAII
jgi:Zn-finger domain-containing protein